MLKTVLLFCYFVILFRILSVITLRIILVIKPIMLIALCLLHSMVLGCFGVVIKIVHIFCQLSVTVHYIWYFIFSMLNVIVFIISLFTFSSFPFIFFIAFSTPFMIGESFILSCLWVFVPLLYLLTTH